MTFISLEKNEGLVLKNILIRSFKYLIIISVIINLFFLFYIDASYSSRAFYRLMDKYDNTLRDLGNLEILYNTLSWEIVVSLIIISILFLSFWDVDKDNIFSVIRDIVAMLIFIAFSIMFFESTNMWINLILVVTVYLTISISNFGGLYDTKNDFKDIIRISVIILIGRIITYLIEWRIELNIGEITTYFLEIAMVYIISVLFKLILYPDSILTIDIKKKPELLKFGFGLLCLIILWPLCGSFFGLIFGGVFYLINSILPFGKHQQVNTVYETIFATSIIPGLFLVNNLLFYPAKFVFFIIALLNHIKHYLSENFFAVEDGKPLEYIHTKSNIVDYLSKFPASANEKISLPFIIFGILSLLYNAYVLFSVAI